MTKLSPEQAFRRTPCDVQNRLRFSQAERQGAILIYDKILEKKFATFIRGFPRRYAVKSGEGLKDLKAFPGHMQQILKLADGVAKSDLRIVVLGGGSVGDFAGFVASILKRGVPVVQVPSTWLAAVDSAHGGKTALNVEGYKNQVGSFWPARRCVLAKDLLLSQPLPRLQDSYAEILKIALLQGGTLWRSVIAQKPSTSLVWRLLPQLIQAKWRVVSKDPFEQTGVREILNLGHTLGHVFEKEKKWSHGKAVLWGLRFAVDFSVERGLVRSQAWLNELRSHPYWPSDLEFQKELRTLKSWRASLSKDKKAAREGKFRFILLKAPGRPVVAHLSIDEIGAELRRQSGHA